MNRAELMDDYLSTRLPDAPRQLEREKHGIPAQMYDEPDKIRRTNEDDDKASQRRHETIEQVATLNGRFSGPDETARLTEYAPIAGSSSILRA